MPLSEEELRMLEQMERALVAEDPKLASTLRGTRDRQSQRRYIALGVLAFVGGVVLLMSGAVLSKIYLGVGGFVVMLGAAYFTLSRWRGQSAATTPPPSSEGTGEHGLRVIAGGKSSRRRSRPAKGRQPKTGSMMERFEERWRRRREGGP